MAKIDIEHFEKKVMDGGVVFEEVKTFLCWETREKEG